jgi:hypothetical protein
MRKTHLETSSIPVQITHFNRVGRAWEDYRLRTECEQPFREFYIIILIINAFLFVAVFRIILFELTLILY